MTRLWRYARQYRGRWIWGAFLLLLTNATTVALPQLFRAAIDNMTDNASRDYLQSIALLMVILAVAGAVFRVLSRVHIFYAARDVEMDLRCDFYAHLSKQSGDFFAAHPTGDLMSRATSDLGQVRLMLGPGVLNFINTLIAYAATVPLMLMISPYLTAVALGIFQNPGFSGTRNFPGPGTLREIS